MNRQVRVELTDAGRQRLAASDGEAGLSAEQREGPAEWRGPLWELANIFGPALRGGVPETPFVGNDVHLSAD